VRWRSGRGGAAQRRRKRRRRRMKEKRKMKMKGKKKRRRRTRLMGWWARKERCGVAMKSTIRAMRRSIADWK
jgi:hypothetical protein